MVTPAQRLRQQVIPLILDDFLRPGEVIGVDADNPPVRTPDGIEQSCWQIERHPCQSPTMRSAVVLPELMRTHFTGNKPCGAVNATTELSPNTHWRIPAVPTQYASG